MDPLASGGPAVPSDHAGGPARACYTIMRAALGVAVALAAIALSVLASVWGLSAVLVGAALAGLVVLRIVQRNRAERAVAPSARTGAGGAAYAPAFVITAVAIIGFFVLLTLASQIWASR